MTAESQSTIDLDSVPGLQPPNGETSNLVNPSNMNQYLYVTVSLCLGLSSLAVIVRIFAKGWVMRKLQLEELTLVLSQCGFIAFVGILIHASKLGEGAHQWNVSVSHVQKIIELVNILEIIYCPVIMGAKITLLLQLKRLFIVLSKGVMYWLHHAILWANLMAYLAAMISLIFACVPREKLWNPSIPGHCQSIAVSLIGTSVLNILSDITCFIIPLVIISRLHLPRRSKILLATMFGTVVFAIITSFCRLAYSIKLIRTDDFTWAAMPVGLWAIAEISCVVLASSVPLIPGIVKFVRNPNSSTDIYLSGRDYPKFSRVQDNSQQYSERQKNVRGDTDGEAGWVDPKYHAHISTSSLVDHDEISPFQEDRRFVFALRPSLLSRARISPLGPSSNLRPTISHCNCCIVTGANV